MKLKNKHLNYYCKNDICVELNSNSLPVYVEFPDEKGNIKGYITDSYPDADGIHIIPKKNTLSLDENTYFSYQCTSDLQCITNKCIYGFWIFNEENPTEFCTFMYHDFFIFEYSPMHCGKMKGDICEENKRLWIK